MHRQNAVGLQVTPVLRECFLCEQMNRYRIAGEGIYGEHVERLRRLPLERKTGIADRNADILRTPEIVESFRRDIAH